MLRRTTTAALATTALGVFGALGATAAQAGSPTLKLAHTSAGNLLETGAGLVVYQFSADGRNHDKCVSVSGCASVWPPLLAAHPIAGTGVNRSLLGTITISGGRHQVTYAGHPVYYYAGESRGETDYLGQSSFGGTWRGIGAGGAAVR